MSKVKKYYTFVSTMFLVSSILIIVIAGGAFLYFLEMKRTIDEQSTQAKILREKTTILSELKVKNESLSKDRAIVEFALPREKEASRLILGLDNLTKQHGLEFISIKSNAQKTRKKTPDTSLLQTERGEFSQEMPLTVDVRGSYQNLTGFIKATERHQRLINISSIEISESDIEETIEKEIKATLNITVYLKK